MAEFLKADEEAEREEAIEPGVAAIAIALDHAKTPDPPSANAVEEFLASQRELIADQRHHLAAQYRTLALDRWSKRLKLALQGLTILVGVLGFAFVGSLVWQAHKSDGVVIEPFGVPTDMAASRFIRKWVCPIQALIVPKGCSTILRLSFIGLWARGPFGAASARQLNPTSPLRSGGRPQTTAPSSWIKIWSPPWPAARALRSGLW